MCIVSTIELYNRGPTARSIPFGEEMMGRRTKKNAEYMMFYSCLGITRHDAVNLYARVWVGRSAVVVDSSGQRWA